MNTTHGKRLAQLGAGIVSLLVVSSVVMRVSGAAFTDTTVNSGNQWTAGDVVLTDDDVDTAMFTVNNMKPLDAATECIEVTYSGSLDASVALYGSITAGDGLDAYLDLTVRRGTGGSSADCTGFSSTAVVYTGSLAGFVSSHSSFGTGAGAWAATGGAPDDVVTYQFVVGLQDDDNAQGLTSTAMFTWEAQNT